MDTLNIIFTVLLFISVIFGYYFFIKYNRAEIDLSYYFEMSRLDKEIIDTLKNQIDLEKEYINKLEETKDFYRDFINNQFESILNCDNLERLEEIKQVIIEAQTNIENESVQSVQ